MKTMTDNRYIPTWERKYDKWDTEPEYWENDIADEPSESDEISIDLVDENEFAFELDESEFDLDNE